MWTCILSNTHHRLLYSAINNAVHIIQQVALLLLAEGICLYGKFPTQLDGLSKGVHAGRWASSLQVKQKVEPQVQHTSKGSPCKSVKLSTAYWQSGAGHHSTMRLSSTYERSR